MTIAVSYTVIGMALLSMKISLIQEGVTLKAQAMRNKMGFGKSAKVKSLIFHFISIKYVV